MYRGVVYQQAYGRGLSRMTDDFGKNSARRLAVGVRAGL
jgi:hypothetical protein